MSPRPGHSARDAVEPKDVVTQVGYRLRLHRWCHAKMTAVHSNGVTEISSLIVRPTKTVTEDTPAGKAGEIIYLQTQDAGLGQIQHARDGGKMRIGDRAAGVNAGNLGENSRVHLLGPVANSAARGYFRDVCLTLAGG